MLKVRVIPCLDVKDGRVVKGVNFEGLRDAGDPVEQAIIYDAAGADELCFLDITASHEERGTLLDVVRRTAEVCFMPLTVGGGRAHPGRYSRPAAGGRRQGFDQHRCGQPPGIRPRSGGEIRQPVHCRRHRRQEAPATARYEIFTHGGRNATGIDAVEHARKLVGLARAKSCSPPWTATAPSRAMTWRSPAPSSDAVTVPVIASGGVGNAADLVEGVTEGHASAVLAASIFHFGEVSIAQAKAALKAAGLPVRPV